MMNTQNKTVTGERTAARVEYAKNPCPTRGCNRRGLRRRYDFKTKSIRHYCATCGLDRTGENTQPKASVRQKQHVREYQCVKASVEPEAAHTPKLWKEQSFLHFPERAFIVEALNNIERVTAQRDALLAAAKEVVQANNDGMECEPGIFLPFLTVPLRDKLEAAIAQASGEIT